MQTEVRAVQDAMNGCGDRVWQRFSEHCKRELGAGWLEELRGFAEPDLREVLREFWTQLPTMPAALRRARAVSAVLQWADSAESLSGSQRGGHDSRSNSGEGGGGLSSLPSARSSISSQGSMLCRVAPEAAQDAGCGLPRIGSSVQRHDTRKILSRLPLFGTLPTAAVGALASSVRVERVGAGATVFRAGDEGAAMVVVLEGSLSLVAPCGDHLGCVREGNAVGEISVLYPNVQRQASAVAGPSGATLGLLNKADIDLVTSAQRCRDALMSSAQRIDYVKRWFLTTVPLVAPLRGNTGFMDALVGALENHQAPNGTSVVVAGKPGNDMFFLVSGECEVLSRGRPVAAIRAGSYFGEKAMLYGGERTATVRTKVHSHMYRLTKTKFDAILDRFPECMEAVYGRAQESKHLKEHFIRIIPLFSEMKGNAEFVLNLAHALTSRNYRTGEVIIREGDSDSDMFLLAHGTVAVHKQGKGEVARLEAGAFFGELSLVYNQPRQATVKAASPSHLYSLSQEAFETIAAAFPAWWDAISTDRSQGLFAKVEGVELARRSKYHNLEVPEVRGGRADASELLRARMRRREESQGGEAPGTEDRLREMMDERLCVVCAERDRSVVLVPCGHAMTCKQCAADIRARTGQCPTCRQAVTDAVEAYF
eukprot:TRINITY_DN804_c1_g1_i1.p1 TRINITY_DN804_c1_g1~~TRINITY_DN804_c1_g1_i1.p1  ORF type:complete len:653 (+),score=195.05 TRINITY_DN804_c1_g1_i1:111-2069(+)